MFLWRHIIISQWGGLMFKVDDIKKKEKKIDKEEKMKFIKMRFGKSTSWILVGLYIHDHNNNNNMADLRIRIDSISSLAVCVYVYNLIYISIGCRLNFFFLSFLPFCNSTATRTTAIVYPPIFGFSYFLFLFRIYTLTLSPHVQPQRR